MTVKRFLKTTSIPLEDIAREVGTHLTRVYHWRAGKSHPGGKHLARLILVSDNAIKIEAVAGKPRPKNLSILKTA